MGFGERRAVLFTLEGCYWSPAFNESRISASSHMVKTVKYERRDTEEYKWKKVRQESASRLN